MFVARGKEILAVLPLLVVSLFFVISEPRTEKLPPPPPDQRQHKRSNLIPIYYTCPDEAIGRIQLFENEFSKVGAERGRKREVIRVSPINCATDFARDFIGGVESNVTIQQFSENEGISPKEVCSFMTDVEAIQKGFDAGEKYLLLLHDDMSHLLVPLWGWGIEDIVGVSNKLLNETWHALQLHVVAIGAESTNVYEEWKFQGFDNPHLASPKALLDPNLGFDLIGSGATLYSRKGMEKVLHTYKGGTQSEGKFRCGTTAPSIAARSIVNETQEGETRSSVATTSCTADKFLWENAGEGWVSRVVLPPMFTQSLNENGSGTTWASLASWYFRRFGYRKSDSSASTTEHLGHEETESSSKNQKEEKRKRKQRKMLEEEIRTEDAKVEDWCKQQFLLSVFGSVKANVEAMAIKRVDLELPFAKAKFADPAALLRMPYMSQSRVVSKK